MSEPTSPIRVLVVDGDDRRQALYRAALDGQLHGRFTLLPADRGEKGLTLVHTLRPDCIIVAAALPDMTGMAFAGRLGRSDENPGPGLILALLPGEEDDAQAAIGGAIDDFVIGEPLSPPQLRRALANALAVSGLRRRLAAARHAASGAGFDDPLTALATRSLFHNRLVHAVILAKRGGQAIGVMAIELGQLKDINYMLGDEVGDAALREAARRLTAILREADTVARISGNRFGVLMHTGATYEGGAVTACKIQQALRQPFDYDGRPVDLTPDIGIALFPDHGDTSDTLVNHAEAAMRLARRQGGGHAIFAADAATDDFDGGRSVA